MSGGLMVYIGCLVLVALVGAIWIWNSPNATVVDEAQLLEEWFDKKSEDDPGWYRETRKSACRAALNRGVSREILRCVYSDVFDEVLAESPE